MSTSSHVPFIYPPFIYPRDGEGKFGVLQNGAPSREAANSGITEDDAMLFGAGLHAYQDSYSHAAYGPKLGHAGDGEFPDLPYNDPVKAILMARRTYEMMDRWRRHNHGLGCQQKFDDFKDKLDRLFRLPGSEEERALRWQTQISKDFGGNVKFIGDKYHIWSDMFYESVKDVSK